MNSTRLLGLLAVAFMVTEARAELRFNRDIRPILADRCFNCHGADEKTREADLRLDLAEGAYADGAIVPGDPSASELIERIFADDPDDVMPPADHPLQLEDGEKEILKQWIKEGAKYEGHWGFTRPERGSERGPQAIDGFIRERLAEEGLELSPEANRETLIRRLSLDLTGIPPTVEEIEAFLADDQPQAYERLVDRLLASPRYGERLAMWWLDGARYADSHGFQADWERHQWPWRDWVINAFNGNQPFDEFTIEQLAGDMLPNARNDQIVATAFGRNHRINAEGGALNDEWLIENVMDRLETTGSVWLGLTLNCARCHDHKYDPLTQREFYEMFSIFHNVPERGVERGRAGNFEPTIQVLTPAQEKAMAETRARIAAKEKVIRDERLKAASLIQDAPDPGLGWRLPSELAIKSDGGTEFSLQDDGTYAAGGKDPKRDGYEVTLQVGPEPVTGLLLELHSHAKLKNKGFTRKGNGNPVLTKAEARLADGSHRIEITEAKANYEQKGWPAAAALDGKDNKGWAIDGHAKQGTRRIQFKFKQRLVADKAQTVVLRLEFKAFDHSAPARIKVLWTSAGQPSLEAAEPLSPELLAAMKTPHGERDGNQIKLLVDHVSKHPNDTLGNLGHALNGLKQELAELGKVTVMVMKEMEKPRKTFILDRGEYHSPTEEVQAGIPAFLPPLPEGEKMNRLGFARWLVSPEHPLTARVQVNRLWEMLFGTGLVESSENLGVQADWPSHPELLDWLAVEFVESGWDVKSLIKTMVMTRVYRQASDVDAVDLEKDPKNRWLARGPRFRVQAEIVRDQALAIAGLLNEEIGGPSVRPYQPPGIWSEFNFYGNLRNYKHDRNGNQYRRSLYTIWKRTAAPPGMTLFDMPSREVCTVRRARTNTPLQALALMNEVTYVEASRKFAERMMTQGETPEQWLSWGWRRATSREATGDEMKVLLAGFERRLKVYEADPAAAAELLKAGESPTAENLDPVKLAALTTAASVILNLDEVVTKG
ncbi:MAG: PSD1 and planctomycete cytochrome C domain-containing protein [Verrucomicrobiota bacterium]